MDIPAGSDRLTVRDYYHDACVWRRLLENCGGADAPTAAYLAAYEPDASGHYAWETARPRPMSDLAAICDAGQDVARSLWDADNLLLFFELDYQNIDRPDEPFVHPVDVFFKLEPAYRAAQRILHELGIVSRVEISGRSYHFTGRIPLAEPVVDALGALVPKVPAWYATHSLRRPAFVTATLTERQARANAGLGLLVEYVAHLVLAELKDSAIPVVVNGTVVGNGFVGRESVSIDFSHVGDPLDIRHVRAAFSTYQIHRLQPDVFGWQLADAVPPLASIPRERLPLFAWLSRGRSLDRGRRLAEHHDGRIPDVAAGIEKLLAHYMASSLSAFHRRFYEGRHGDTSSRAFDPSLAPPCIAGPLLRPNDLLLKPEHIQHMVRGLMAGGWTPADIAALVQAAYQADHDWGPRFRLRMDPETRADFEVRVFAGLIETGIDSLVDFNCVSAQEKDVCPRIECPHDLRIDRERLLRRSG